MRSCRSEDFRGPSDAWPRRPGADADRTSRYRQDRSLEPDRRIRRGRRNADTVCRSAGGNDFARQFAAGAKTALTRLSMMEGAKEAARKGLGVLASFISSVKLSYGEISVSVDPLPGYADSCTLDTDMTELMLKIGEAAPGGREGLGASHRRGSYLDKAGLSVFAYRAASGEPEAASDLLCRLLAAADPALGRAGKILCRANLLVSFDWRPGARGRRAGDTKADRGRGGRDRSGRD